MNGPSLARLALDYLTPSTLMDAFFFTSQQILWAIFYISKIPLDRLESIGPWAGLILDRFAYTISMSMKSISPYTTQTLHSAMGRQKEPQAACPLSPNQLTAKQT